MGFVEPALFMEGKVPSLDQKFFLTTTAPTNRRRKRCFPRIDVVPHGVEAYTWALTWGT